MLYEELSYKIRGAIYDVQHELGPGLLEKCYQEALALELRLRGLKVEREKRIPVVYKGVTLQQEYIADLIVEDKVIIELKAVKALDDTHRAQTINYLRLTGLKLGLLVNFYHFKTDVERLINPDTKE